MSTQRIIGANLIRGVMAAPNYITNGDAELSGAPILGWSTFADAAGTSPVDGTGGSPASTFAISADTTVIGGSNFLWTKSAADRQGEGFSYDFSIDSAYQSKPLTISALYKVASGTYVDNDMSVWIYDVTNAVLIQPSAYNIKNSTGVEQIKCEFQAASNSTSYRLIFHTASTSASAYTLRFDSFSISPNTYSTGAGITDWVAYTPTFTGFGTATSPNVVWRRVGGSIEIRGVFTSGTSTGTEARISIPPGLSSLSTLPALSISGTWGRGAASASHGGVMLIEPSVGYLTLSAATVFSNTSSTAIAKGNGNDTVGSGELLSFIASFPVAGWGTSQVLSSDTDTRVVAAIVSGSPANSYTANNPIIFPTVSKDTHGAYNASTGKFTAPVEGYYQVDFQVYANYAVDTGFFLYIDAVAQSSRVGHLLVANRAFNASRKVYLTAGQTVDVRANNNATTTQEAGYLSVSRVSGPAQIAASEKIAAVYTLSANTTPGAGNPLIFNTKVIDSHGAYSTSTGRFTAPSARNYMVNTSIAFNATAGYLVLYKNGVAYQDVAYSGTGAGQSYLSTNTVVVPMLAGDYIDLRAAGATQFGGGANGSGLAPITSITITSQG